MTYEYYCKKCDRRCDIEKPMKDASREEKCPICGCKLQRLYSEFITDNQLSGSYDADRGVRFR